MSRKQVLSFKEKHELIDIHYELTFIDLSHSRDDGSILVEGTFIAPTVREDTSFLLTRKQQKKLVKWLKKTA